MATYTCWYALLLFALFSLGVFGSGLAYLSPTKHICAGPKDMGNVSTQLQFFGSLSSCLHRQNYMRRSKKAYLGRRALYYSNSTATTQLLLLKLSGNVESNPGPQGPQGSFNNSSKTLCSNCAKTMRRNQNGVRC